MCKFTDAITRRNNDNLCCDGEELGFSWRACDCCGSSLGGDRFKACKLTKDHEVIDFSVCVDCILYIANGEVPDNWS